MLIIHDSVIYTLSQHCFGMRTNLWKTKSFKMIFTNESSLKNVSFKKMINVHLKTSKLYTSNYNKNHQHPETATKTH